mgnify:CR=1 FL=1
MRPSMRAAVTMIVMALLLAGCAGQGKAVILTGEGLDALGKQFVSTAHTYNLLLAANKITPEEYRAWAVFAQHFKLTYPAVVESWKKASDAKSAQEAADALLTLKSGLVAYVIAAQAKKGGM